jgi:hypothetical protein
MAAEQAFSRCYLLLLILGAADGERISGWAADGERISGWGRTISVFGFSEQLCVLRCSMVSSKQSVNWLEDERALRQAEIVMALSLATDLGTGRPIAGGAGAFFVTGGSR